MEYLPIILLLVLVLVFIVQGLKIITPYQRGVVERLGRYKRTAQPGVNLLIPFIDNLRRVDMREQVIDVPPQDVITKDNVAVQVDAVIYHEATDPVKLIYNIENFLVAIIKLAQTNLRNLVGEMQLDQALTSRDTINTNLRNVLDEATDKWGVRVVRVEIQRIEPPSDVTDSMHQQMKAEREKRAAILESEGQRQAAILQAEGEAQAVRLAADAKRYQVETEATGESNAITVVFNAIREAQPDDRLIAVRYLDTLEAMSQGDSNKIFIPYEASGVLGALGGIKELFNKDDANTAS
ncbi:MAG: SPFH/Band 7/PHB domain protein [Caldilineaceae bacterium]|nr:SPFH/Band 7/PHB domain protein [Caldilineaceae bacterium]